MRVIVVPNRSDAMGYYRLMWPALALQQQGYDVHISHGDNAIKWLPDKDGNVADVNTPECDVVVIQRCTQRLLVQIIQLWQQRGVKVVMDLDDDFRHIDAAANPSAYNLLHTDDREVHWKYTEQAIDIVDGLVVSVQALHDMYGGMIVRNQIPSWYLDVYRMPVADIFGWTGGIKLRRTDPEVVGLAFRWLQGDGYRMGVIGPPDGIKDAFRLRDEPVSPGMLRIDDYAEHMSRFAVGTAPAKNIRFNQSKSWLKMLEYAALGVPCVVSPIPEYMELWRQGVGVVAYTPKDWYHSVTELLTDKTYAESLSAAGREVASRRTIEGNADLWWRAWTATLNEPRHTASHIH